MRKDAIQNITEVAAACQPHVIGIKRILHLVNLLSLDLDVSI